MRAIRLNRPCDFEEWRHHARLLLAEGVPPADIVWRTSEEDDLFSTLESAPPPSPEQQVMPAVRVPRAFLTLAEAVLCHSDPHRHALLYRMLYRLQTNRALLAVMTDPDVLALRGMAKAVSGDGHRMCGLLRFREVPHESPGPDTTRRRFVAWYEPDHFVVGLTAPFFCRRFSDMDWAILTPKGCAFFVNGELRLSDEPAAKPDIRDATEDLWRTYYTSIFNPARLKVKTMQGHMPKRFWGNLPEAQLIPSLITGAEKRVADMTAQAQQWTALPSQPSEEDDTPATLSALNAAIRRCARCPLYRCAERIVCGEGPENASLMIVGEQPGDQEDRAGRPFIGPAGQVLDRALEESGIDRSRTYVTNAVKHFKFERRGTRRIHKTAAPQEVRCCRHWLEEERRLIAPRLILSLGATALKALTRSRCETLGSVRGQVLALEDGTRLVATVHPSFLLRLPDAARRAEETERFHADIRRIVSLLKD